MIHDRFIWSGIRVYVVVHGRVVGGIPALVVFTTGYDGESDHGEQVWFHEALILREIKERQLPCGWISLCHACRRK